MRRVLLFSALAFYFAASVNAQSHSPSANAQATPPAAKAAPSPGALNAARASFAKLPLSFEENAGQTDGRVKYTSRGAGYNLFLTSDEAVFALHGGSTSANCSRLSEKTRANCAGSSKNASEGSILWLKMLGANASAQVTGTDVLPGKVNYYIGNNPSKWRTGVRQYGRVSYSGIYPGVDLTYYGNQQQLESDFVVAPGTNPRSIEFEVKGANRSRLDTQGNLLLSTNSGNVQLLRPVVYQIIQGSRREISGRYVLRSGNRVGFAVGAYDRREKLIIDPTLVYATYLGGSSLSSGDNAQAIAIDASGNAYVTGQGSTADFPGSDIAGPPVSELSDFAFVTVFSPTGSPASSSAPGQLIYSTILSGSSGLAIGNGIGVDSSKNAYIAGSTSATDFPMVNPFQATYGDPTQSGFVAGLANASSSTPGALIYSTYFGGRNTNDSSELQGLFADSTGNVYVVGDTTSPNFPTVNSLPQLLNGFQNVVVAKFNNQGQAQYSTYLGGNGSDFGTAITADASGNAYITGYTSSSNFPLQTAPAPFQSARAGSENVFVSKLAFSGSTLSMPNSTYVGGNSTDQAMGIAVDSATPPSVYVTGETTSSTFPFTAGALSTTNAGGTDAFITKVKGDFTALTYSTYLGGSGTDIGYAIGLDASNNAYVTGSTTSANFPTKLPLQSANGSVSGTNAFLAELNTTGTALNYSTYLGGTGTDAAFGIAVDSTGNAYIAGKTTSANFPVMSGGGAGTSPFQGQIGGSAGNAFVAKISPAAAAALLNFFPPSYNFHNDGLGASSVETVTVSNNTVASATVNSLVFGGANSGDFTLKSATAPCLTSGSFTLAAGASCTITIQFAPTDQDGRAATLTATYNGTSTSVMNLSGSGGAPEVSLSSTSINFGTVLLNVQGTGGVTVTNTGAGPLQIGSAQITPAGASPFSVSTSSSSCFTTPIAPGGSCSIELLFVPTTGTTAGTTFNATLLINSNAAGSPASLSLTGIGKQQVLVQPTSLELGIQVVNSTSTNNQNEAFLQNGSGETINITVTPGTGADQGDFHLTSFSGENSCSTVGALAPGGSCFLVVYFQPQAASATDGRTGSYTIGWTGTSIATVVPGSQIVNVMGTGITGISLLTNSITAPNEYVGFTEGSAGLEFLANGTPNPITVTTALSGNNPGDFTAALDSTCAPGGVVPANTYCRVNLSFTPSALGLRTATVTFSYTGVSNGQLTLSLSGTGIPGPVFITSNSSGFAQQISSFDFGSEIISTTTPEKVFQLRNAATSPLTVQPIAAPGNTDFKFTPDSSCPVAPASSAITVPGGGSCFIGMTFTPTTTGSKETTSIVITDAYTSTNGTDAASPHTLTLNGTGELAAITVSVTSGGANLLDFGNVALNPSPVPQAAIYLANAGNSSTTISWTGGSPVLTTAGTAFGLVASGANLTTCTQGKIVLPQGGNCLIGVTFAPTIAGLQTNSVTFSDSLGGSHTINIQGTAVGQGKISLSTTTTTTFQQFTFEQLEGTTSSAQTVTVANLGSGPLTITSLPTFGTNISNFTILPSSTCAVGTVIASGSSGNTCVFNVTFSAPVTPGSSSEDLEILVSLGNGATGSAFVELSGNSVSGGFLLSPVGPISFGTVAVGSTVTSAFYTLTNENATSVTFGTMTVPAGYTISDDGCSGQVVTASSECFFEISFTPTSAAAFNGNLSLPFTGATGTPYTVGITGTGSAAVVASPNPLNFQTSAGSTSFETVTIGNGSASTATITAVSAFTGANAADYSFSFDGCFFSGVGSVLSPSGGNCTFDINFLSPTAGTFTAQFTVSYSIGGVAQTPITVTMNATIPASLVTATPNPVVFSSQTVNTQSQIMFVTLTNSASATQTLNVNGLQISGNDFAIFSPGSQNCFNIAAGATCTIPVTFTPSLAGARAGTLTITDNSTTSPHVVNLQGTGIAGTVSASPSNLIFPLTTVGSSLTMGAVLSNTTGSAITVNSVVFTGPYATDIGAGTCVNGNKVTAVTDSCVVYIKFTPTGVSNSGSATVNYTGGSVVITLSGAGTNPNVNVNPSSLIFSSQAVGTQSSAQPVTLSNPTSSAANSVATSITGTNASDFIFGTNACAGTNLAAGANCVVNVIFKPAASGGTSRAATLSITDSDPNSPHTVSLSGTAIQPVASLSGSSLAFGSVDTGTTTAQQSLTLTNTGNASMTITSVVLGGANAGDFAEVAPSSGTNCVGLSTLTAGSSCVVAATFTPTAIGSRSATITITDNATPATQVINLSGTGAQPGVTFLPTTIAFGNQRLSVASAQSTSTLTNSGTGPLTISNVALGGTNSGDYALVTPTSGTDCRTVGTIAAGGNCVIAATFTPSALGSRTATISVTDNASGSPQSLPLTGTGVFPQATPTPSPVPFGNQILNVPSAAQTLTLTNGGSATLNLSTVVLGGTNASQFAIATGTTCTNGSTVAAGATCLVKLTFTPTTLGAQAATITFTDDASPTTQVVNLTGTGVFPQASASPSPVAFGNQRENATSNALTLTLSNGGTGTLSLTTVALGGTNASQFAIATGTTCTNGSTVLAGANCVVKLTFTPTALGAQTATITFTDNANPTTQVVNLTGTGVFPQASPAPATVPFGSQTNGITSGPQTVTLTNGGSGTLNLATVALGGTNPAAFAIVAGTSTCTNGSTIVAGASCVVNVTFTPSGLSSFAATLTFTDDASPITQVVNLTGTGVTSTVNFNPSTVAFGNQRQGTASAQMTSTLTNTGSAALAISNITITGTNPGDFTLVTPASGTDCRTVGSVSASGGTCVIAATFTPSALGGRAATVSVTDNASGSPHSLALTGTGVFPQATPTPSPVPFGNQILNVPSAAQTLTLTNAGSATLNLSTVVLGGTNASQFAIATGTTCTNGSTVAVGANCVVKLTFTPTTLGAQTATVTFTDDASPTTQVVNLTGTGVFPQASASPSPVAFGNQRENATSNALTLTLSNGGTGTLSLTTVALGGTNASQFAIATGTTCTNGSTVLAGANCVVKLTFTPTALGAQTATITFTDNANPTTQVVNLTGTGVFPQASPAPATVPFGSQTNGITSGPQTITLTNGGTGTLNLATVALGGTNPAAFAIVAGTSTCTNGSTVAAGASCVVNVTFTPSGLSSFAATLTFTDDASPITQVVNLTGTGVTSTVNFNPSTVAFGNQRQGTASAQMTSTLTNTGSAALAISNITITGTNPGDFTLVTPASGTDCRTVGSVSASGGTCVIAATFTPSALGGRAATVSVTDNASGSPHSLALTGTGVFPQATPTPSPVPFGNQILNVPSAAQTLTLTNGGSATLNLSTVVLGGTNASQFAIATGTTCTNGSTVAAGATCLVKLTFTPTTLGAQAATITFTDDASPTTQVVNLTGTGVFPQASASPSPVAFGNQRENATSNALTLTLSNGGTGTLSLTTVALGGTNASQFAIATGTTCTNGSTVLAGANCVVKLTFTPTALGAQTATITFTDNANPTTQVVNLTGTGVFPQASPAPATVPFGSQTNGITSGPQTITLTNGGTGTLNLATVALGGTNPAAFAIVAGTSTCTNGSTVAAGASCVVNVTFTPSGLSSFAATLTFTDDASPITQVVNLTGTGVTSTVNFNPSTVAFGNQRQGTASAQMTSTLTNTGSAALAISNITITGTNPADFTLVTPASGTDCRTVGSVSASGGTCVIAATFTPSALGGRAATVSVTDNASGSPHTLALTGTGTAPAVGLSATTVTFPNQIQVTTSAPQTLTVTNTGTATLNISSISLGGTNPSDFAIVSGSGTTCIGAAVGFTAPNNTCTVALTFTPATANLFSATLTITDDASPTTQVVNLSGTGVTPPTATPSPTSLAFPSTATTTTSTALNIALANSGGAPLSVASIALTGTDAGQYVLTAAANGAVPACTLTNGTVAAGASCNVAVQFKPTSTGAHNNAAVTFTDNAGGIVGTQQNVTITGTATAPDLAISKTHSGSFEVGVNNTYTITLKNNGTAATQQQITVTDTLPAGLGFVSGAPASWTCNANGQAVTCTNAGPIAIGATSPLTLTVSVAAAAFPTVTNSATVADAGDSGSNDKTATDSPTAVTAPDVTPLVSHVGDFAVNSNGVYSIKVTNNGSGPTTGNITVTDTLPAGLGFVSNTGAGWSCAAGAQNPQIVTCTYTGAALAPAGSSTFTLTASVAPGAFPSVTNGATVSDPNDGKGTDKSSTDATTNIDNAVPTQTAFSPNLGLIAGATSAQQITITGTGFNSTTIVTLGATPPLNTPLTGTANAAGTSLVISVPTAELAVANAGNLTITVTNPKNPTSNLGGGPAASTLTLPLVGMSSIAPQTGTPTPVPVVAGTPFALQMNVSLTPSGATLPADVTITCSFTPPLTGATCTPNPSTIAKGATTASSVISITAVPTKSGNSGAAPSLPGSGGHGPWSTPSLWLIAAILLSMLGMLGAVRQRAAQFRRAPMYLMLALLVLAAGALVGCTSASGPTPTPTGPASLTVTATTADGATVSTTVSINVSN